jgi:predicted methyltransferase
MRQIDYSKVIESPTERELYEALSRTILSYLELSGPSTHWDLVRFVGGSDRRVLRLLNQMVECAMINFSSGYFSSPSSTTPLIPSREMLCPSCRGKIVIIPDSLKYIVEIMSEVYRHRPKPTFVFDQRPVTLETTVRRLCYMLCRGDLQGKKIAVIGDDDLTSLAIALSKAAKNVTVFEIDERLVRFLREQAKELDVKLDVVRADVTEGVPAAYLHQFDVFLTDPTPTAIPFTVFTNFGIQLLKNQPSQIGYVSIYSSAMKKSLELQKAITNLGLLITDLIPVFTEYEFLQATYSPEDMDLLERYSSSTQDPLSFVEHLVRLETTAETRIIPLKFTPDEMIGSATKRVLDDLSKDPSMQDTEENIAYISEMARRMTSKRNQQMGD